MFLYLLIYDFIAYATIRIRIFQLLIDFKIMNYSPELVQLCAAILNEQSNASSHIVAKEPDVIELIYTATADFSSGARYIDRIRNIASNTVNLCKECSKHHHKLDREFCSRSCRDKYRSDHAMTPAEY